MSDIVSHIVPSGVLYSKRHKEGCYKAFAFLCFADLRIVEFQSGGVSEVEAAILDSELKDFVNHGRGFYINKKEYIELGWNKQETEIET